MKLVSLSVALIFVGLSAQAELVAPEQSTTCVDEGRVEYFVNVRVNEAGGNHFTAAGVGELDADILTPTRFQLLAENSSERSISFRHSSNSQGRYRDFIFDKDSLKLKAVIQVSGDLPSRNPEFIQRNNYLCGYSEAQLDEIFAEGGFSQAVNSLLLKGN